MKKSNMYFTPHTLLVGILLLAAQLAVGATDNAAPTANQAESDRRDQANLALYATNSAVLVLPGLVADRSLREVRVLAAATEITTSDPIEFLLVSQESDHAYESLAVSFARPSAVYEALRFIGLTPGRPASPRDLAFWPKGERVLLTVSNLSSNGWSEAVAIEELLWNVRTDAPTPTTGLVFVEAGNVQVSGQNETQLYLPDAVNPHAIASTYNEPATVLDVPRIAAQGSVYGTLKANPARLLAPQSLVQFTMRPERPQDQPRVLDLLLTVQPGPDATTYSLTNNTGTVSESRVSRDALAQAVTNLVRAGHDPFTRIHFDERLRLDECHAAAQFLDSLEHEDGLRIEPPDSGQLFYRAFLPDERNRRREDRVAQPLELRLRRQEDGLHATLTKIKEQWRDDRPEPDLTAEDHPLASPDDMRPMLDKLGSSMPVLLVFAPPDVTLAELQAYLTPARATHGLVHVYLESDSPSPASAPARPDSESHP